MKVLHWAIVFVTLILPMSIVCRNTVDSRYVALKDEVRINNAIDNATKDAIDQIITVSESIEFDNEFGDVINITPALAQESINTFFHTLAVNYNIPHQTTDNTALKESSEDSYIKNYFAPYIPAIVILAYDGFYIYSQENDGIGYEYKLSTKIPYTYDAGNYSIGYTLGNDIYFYINGECYSGRMNYNTLDEIEDKYNSEYASYNLTTSELANITNDISMVLYSLVEKDRITLGDYLYPRSNVDNFLQDYTRDLNGEYTVGDFHKNRRSVIIDIVSSCLTQEFNEHNRYADMLGSTYEFYLPEITADDWVNTIDDITFMAFVQGIPIGTLEGTYFNNYALGGSQIVKKGDIYGEKGYVNETTGKVSNIYHKSKTCPSIADDNYDYIFISEEEALSYGYYPCQLCN